jgi:flagellar P-ring protein precursor FlgI
VPNGGLVEGSPSFEFSNNGTVTFSLREPDFVTATRLAAAINRELDAQEARVIDPGTVVVTVPESYQESVPELMARLEPIPVDADGPARVVINERTGTVVVGAGVQLGSAAVAHGNLSVRISTRLDVSQPTPFSRGGETVVVPQQEIELEEGDAQLVELEAGTTMQDVVRALNLLGATPRDIIAIMQALKAVGALRAQLVII